MTKSGESIDASIKLSEQIANARDKLLKRFQSQMQTTYDGELTPFDSYDEGEPFIGFGSSPPQIAAVKKIINSLYHAEQAVKQWEEWDTSTSIHNALSIEQGAKRVARVYKGVTHVYNSLAFLNDATPEIQALVSRNYALLEPVFANVYALIKENGWESQFSSMDVVSSANTVISQGARYLSKEEGTDPVISFFTNLNDLLTQVVQYQKASSDKEEQRAQLNKLMAQLESNPLTKGVSLQSLQESQSVDSLLSWLKTLRESDFELNESAINKYVSWANQSLSGLIVFTDKLERSNYLQAGILSDPLCQGIDRFSVEVNHHLESSQLESLDKVEMTSSFVSVREQSIHQEQQVHVQNYNQLMGNQEAARDFFNLLENYKGRSLEDIPEHARETLRNLYPKVQEAIAHVNLELDTRLVEVLNQTGPDQLPYQGYVSYFSSFIVSAEVDTIIGKREEVSHFLSQQLLSEDYKLYVAEVACAKLDGNEQNLSIFERVSQRKIEVGNELVSSSDSDEIPRELVAYKASNLKNLRGNFAYLQELGLSKTVHALLVNASTLIRKNLNEQEQSYFTSLPHPIKPDDPDYIQQLKSIENALCNLEFALVAFEGLERNQSYWQTTRSLITLAQAALQVKSSIAVLSPTVRKTLAPILSNISNVGATLSAMNGRENNTTELSSLKDQPIEIVEEASITPEQIDKLHSNRKNAYINLLEVEHHQNSAKQFFETLSRYAERSFAEITPEDAAILRANFSRIQSEWNFVNLDMANELVHVLNRLEQQDSDLPIVSTLQPSAVLAEQTQLDRYILKQHKLAEINFSVTNQELEKGGIAAAHLLTKEYMENEQSLLKIGFEEQIINRKQIGPGELTPAFNLAGDIATARQNVLNLLKSNLSPAITNQLVPNPNPKEVPFIINVDNDPPQLQAIKRFINSMHHAEIAARKWNQIQYNPNSFIDQAIMVKQGLHVVSEMSIAIRELSEIGPEINDLLKNNYDLIAPMMEGASKLITENKWMKFAHGNDRSKIEAFASILGQGVNALNPGLLSSSTSQTLVEFLTSVPRYINTMSTMLDKSAASDTPLVFSPDKLKGMTAFFDLYLENKQSLNNYLHAGNGMIGFVQLYTMFSQERDTFYRTGAIRYQSFLKDNYANVLAFLEEVEVKNYLKPGTLTTPFQQQIEELTQTMNTYFGSKEKEIEEPTFKIPEDIPSQRLGHLRDMRYSYWEKLGHLSIGKTEATCFFEVLSHHKGKVLSDLSKEELKTLREQLFRFQDSLAAVDAQVTNHLITQLNQLENSEAVIPDNPLAIDRLLGLKESLNSHFTHERASTEFKVKVINVAIQSLGSISEDALNVEKMQHEQWQINYKIQLRHAPGPGELTPTPASPVPSLSNYLSSLQEVKLSERLHQLADQFRSAVKASMSDKVIEQLGSPKKQGLYDVQPDSPTIVKEIQLVENAFVRMEQSLLSLESMKKDGNLFAQATVLVALAQDARELSNQFNQIGPELQQQYAAIGSKVQAMCSYVGSLKSQIDSQVPFKEPETPSQKPPGEQQGKKSSGFYQLSSEYMKTVSSKIDQYVAYLDLTYTHLEGNSLSSPEEAVLPTQDINEVLELKDIVQQLSEMLVKLKMKGAESNAKLINQLIEFKKRAYGEALYNLSKLEDELYLKPGTLLDQGVEGINDLFKGVALELDNLPFELKLELADESNYLTLVKERTEQEIGAIKKNLEQSPEDKNLLLQLDLKKDKIDYLDGKLKNAPKGDIRKSELLDAQFNVLIKRAVSEYQFNTPEIKIEYERAFKVFYQANKNELLAKDAKHIDQALGQMIEQFKQENNANYFLVDKTIKKLMAFQRLLPGEEKQNKDIKNYINKQLLFLIGTNEDGQLGISSITDRVQFIKELPKNSEFKENIYSVNTGSNFFNEINVLLKTFKFIVEKGVKSFSEISTIYHENKIKEIVHSLIKNDPEQNNESQEQHNIDRTKSLREEMASHRPLPSQSDLEAPKSIATKGN
ncbi:hypothetical protein [Legionella waltersii]|uniref:SdhB protein, substrate of the Dot/Icm system n=1 Tax=Legionella waltersii TaxID=66969 RepID=A0A0W1ADD4_9GAMM|nr:hypothetical protein [Legionella waltersii]KTD79349.1 SdhB protein, substrate of the Dot/Icm system [Legionella waltersii]SNU99926.1 protein SdhB [Legionella waltersii]